MVWVPAVVPEGVYVAWQVATAPVPVRLHGEPAKDPAPLLVNVTVPVGVIVGVKSLSVTVAVHTVCMFTWTEEGTQVTLVVVERAMTVTLVVPLDVV